MLLRPSHLAEGVCQSGSEREDQQHLNEIGERSRIFIRMRAISIEKAATVRPIFFDDFLRSHRAHWNYLLGNSLLSCLAVRPGYLNRLGIYEFSRHVRLEILDHALRHKKQ